MYAASLSNHVKVCVLRCLPYIVWSAFHNNFNFLSSLSRLYVYISKTNEIKKCSNTEFFFFFFFLIPSNSALNNRILRSALCPTALISKYYIKILSPTLVHISGVSQLIYAVFHNLKSPH